VSLNEIVHDILDTLHELRWTLGTIAVSLAFLVLIIWVTAQTG
jgi:hypothetical protein